MIRDINVEVIKDCYEFLEMSEIPVSSSCLTDMGISISGYSNNLNYSLEYES